MRADGRPPRVVAVKDFASLSEAQGDVDDAPSRVECDGRTSRRSLLDMGDRGRRLATPVLQVPFIKLLTSPIFVA